MHNLSVYDLNNMQLEPTIQGRIVICVKDGRVQSNTHIPADHLITPLDAFVELSKRCGEGFQKITVPTTFTGQILVTALNGEVIRQQELSANHVVTTLGDIAEVAQQVGIITKKPDTKQ